MRAESSQASVVVPSWCTSLVPTCSSSVRVDLGTAAGDERAGSEEDDQRGGAAGIGRDEHERDRGARKMSQSGYGSAGGAAEASEAAAALEPT